MHQFLKTKEEIKSWLDDMNIKDYVIHADLTVDVNANVALAAKGLTHFPIQFGVIKGDFYCSHNQLVSLKGCPKIVESFTCNDNQLTSLEFSPEMVNDSMDCFNNQLTTLMGMPQKIGGYFNAKNNCLQNLKGMAQQINGSIHLNNNRLTSLEGAPEKVNGTFYINENCLTNLNFAPQVIIKGFNCAHNQLTSLIGGPQYVGGSYSIENNNLTHLSGLAFYIGQTLNTHHNPIQIEHFIEVDLNYFMHTCGHKKERITVFNHLYQEEYSQQVLKIDKDQFQSVMSQLKALDEKAKLEKALSKLEKKNTVKVKV